MAEGDTIHRAVRRVSEALARTELVSIEAPQMVRATYGCPECQR